MLLTPVHGMGQSWYLAFDNYSIRWELAYTPWFAPAGTPWTRGWVHSVYTAGSRIYIDGATLSTNLGEYYFHPIGTGGITRRSSLPVPGARMARHRVPTQMADAWP